MKKTIAHVHKHLNEAADALYSLREKLPESPEKDQVREAIKHVDSAWERVYAAKRGLTKPA